MYIPTIFFGGTESCVNLQISASNFETASIDFGQIGSGSDSSYFYIRVQQNESIIFDVAQGLTTQAKLLLVGGGGYFDSNYLGGAAGGDVIFEDIVLQPGTYFMSSSAYGGNATNNQGGPSMFVTNYLDDVINQKRYIAYGGQPNDTNNDGGSNTNFTGGTGTPTAGAGGAGSAGNGESVISATPASGGLATSIPSPFNAVVGQPSSPDISGSVVSGGGGGYSPISGSAPDQEPQAWGSGHGTFDGGNQDGNEGVAYLFIPINTCEEVPTGSIILPDDEPFEAIGGDLVGTFTSASQDYKYHIFYQGGSRPGTFAVTSGYTDQAKILCVAGGAGSNTLQEDGGAGAGGVSIKYNVTLYGVYNVIGGLGGNAGQNGGDATVTPISTFVTYVGARGGGKGGDGQAGSDGGSGGGGTRVFPNILPPGQGTQSPYLGKYDTADLYLGNDGGNCEVHSGFPYGGGGGGAGSVGENGSPTAGAGGSGYVLDDSFFPSSVLFATSSIARGGDRPLLNTHTTQPYSGDGAMGGGTAGENGFICITYPI